MQADQKTRHLYRLRELADLYVDACIRDEAGRLMFLSVYGRDTALQQLLASFQLPTSSGGMDLVTLENPDAENGLRVVRLFVGDASRLSKQTGRLPRSLFGHLVHAWIYDPVVIQPDKSNGIGWVMLDVEEGSTASPEKARAAVWTMVSHLSPIPLLPHWRDAVLQAMGEQLVVTLSKTSFPPVGRLRAAKVSLPEDFSARISQLVKAGLLLLDPAPQWEKDVTEPALLLTA